jgi:molybdopterin converting factor small subunit
MKILAFGIVKDIFSNSMVDVVLKDDATVDELKTLLEGKYPRLNQLGSYMIAVNELIHEGDEVAIIPPVSGG